jgi:hypothetical protein
LQKSDNPVLGLPYALASQSFCKAFNLDLLEASATLTLAELWLALGPSHARRALSLVYQSLPMILGHGGLELRARAHIVLAKCHLFDPKFSGIYTLPILPDQCGSYSAKLCALTWTGLNGISYVFSPFFLVLFFIAVSEDPCAVLDPLTQATEDLQVLEVSLIYVYIYICSSGSGTQKGVT